MNTKLDQKILKDVTNFYLNSRDFNGISSHELKNNYGISYNELNIILKRLIEKDKLDLRFGDFHPNRFILGMFEYPKDVLLEIMTTEKIVNSCIYPTKKYLARKVDRKKYIGKPFTLKLALGCYHLDFEAFDLSILEIYRNDPRYSFMNTDISGHIYYSGKHKAKNSSDHIYMQDYGFCFNAKNERAIAVFLTRLTNLTPEHQQIWHAKKLKGKYKLHPDFNKISKGHLPEGMSIFESFIREQEKINKICNLIGVPNLFKKIYSIHEKPKEFTFLIRPTLREYENFVHILDKLISENINLDFFYELKSEKEEARKDGKIIVRKKGSIELLDEWFQLHYKHPDKNLIKNTLKSLRQLRRLRQLPAHTIRHNEYDQKFYKEQKKLMVDVYKSIEGIKYMLLVHPWITKEQIESFTTKKTVWLQ